MMMQDLEKYSDESALSENNTSSIFRADRDPFHLQAWMSKLDDDLPVSALSVPGTHDSAAYTLPLPFIATQTMDILAQLDAGIRYFDFRCGLVSNELQMVHGSILLGTRLEIILNDMYSWLAAHQSEALIVQIKKDCKTTASSRNFSQALTDVLGKKSEMWRFTDTTPKIRDLRGKIQLLRRFRGDSISQYGIDVSNWEDNPVYAFTIHCAHGLEVAVQDHYEFVEPTPLPDLLLHKSRQVYALLFRATEVHELDCWFINFMSAYETQFRYVYPPRTVAKGGAYAGERHVGINMRMQAIIDTANKRGSWRYGIVVMDFPHVELITAVIESNFKPRSQLVVRIRSWMLLTLFTLVIGTCYCMMRWTCSMTT